MCSTWPIFHQTTECSDDPKISRKTFKSLKSPHKTTNERETYIKNLEKYSKTLDNILKTKADVQTISNNLEQDQKSQNGKQNKNLQT